VVAAPPTLRASIALALLSTAIDRYRDAVASETIDEYETAYGCATEALILFHRAGVRKGDAINELLGPVRAAFAEIEPGARLWNPDALARALEDLRGAAFTRWGVIDGPQDLVHSVLVRIDKLLGDVVASYHDQVPALSARLAASLYVRSYDPVREEIARTDPSLESRLTDLLGVKLRRLINDEAPAEVIDQAAAEIRSLLLAHLEARSA
jgi:hypothetical protein